MNNLDLKQFDILSKTYFQTEHIEKILNGEFGNSLLDHCKYTPQIEDIIKVSVEKVYKSQEVIEKEIAGYKILTTLLDGYTQAIERKQNNQLRHYDKLLLSASQLNMDTKDSTYNYLMTCCNYISKLTDGNALLLFQKMNGKI